MTRIWLVLLAVLLLAAPAGIAQKKKKDAATRSVSGAVTTSDDKPVVGAMVQLQDTKTKMIRSASTQEKGIYHFYGLSPDIDYELSATYDGAVSSTRTLSTFDSRKEVVINLKLAPKK